MSSPSLAPYIQDLEQAVDDFAGSSHRSCESVLERFVYALDQKPLAGFLQATLPSADFQQWSASVEQRAPQRALSARAINWPSPRPERVALQISLCRALVRKDLSFLNTLMIYFPAGRQVDAHVVKFADQLLRPLVRDISRLSEERPIPSVLVEATGTLPASGDTVLDGLLADAARKFRDPLPRVRLEGTQALWDAWERLKTLDSQDNKRLSAKLLLDRSASSPNFRDLLESEAKELTRIGNQFHIRHFETDRSEFERAEHVDYLYHRMFALIHLLLSARADA